MKKLLILMLVLGLTSLANAGIVAVTDNVTVDLQTDPIDVAVDQQALYLCIGGGGGVLDAGTMLYGGTLAAIAPETDPDIVAYLDGLIGETSTRIDLVEFFDGSATPLPVIGALAYYNVTTLPAVETTVYLVDAEGVSVFDTATIIPEPITIALLGLGGLFLRRRK